MMLEGGGGNQNVEGGATVSHVYDPFAVLYHISPASALSLVPVFFILELHPLLTSDIIHQPALFTEAVVIILTGGGIAFLLILVEIKLVKYASSLTLGMFGSLKEIVQILLSVMVFHDDLSALNVVGLLTALLGAVLYRRYKMMEEMPVEKEGGIGPYSAVQMSGTWTDSEVDDDAML